MPGLVRAARHVDSARWRVLTLRTWRSRVGDFAADLSERDGLPAAGETGRGLLALGRVSPGTSAHAEAATMDELTPCHSTAQAQGGVHAGTPHLTGGRVPCHVLGGPM